MPAVTALLRVAVGLAVVFVIGGMPTAQNSAGDARQGAAVRTVCEPEEQPLFICETNRRERYLAISGD